MVKQLTFTIFNFLENFKIDKLLIKRTKMFFYYVCCDRFLVNVQDFAVLANTG